jgi:signal transduction histidine kinase
VKLNASLLHEDLTGQQADATRNLAHLQRIERATARIERLIADLLDAACIDANALSVHPVPVQANALLAEAAEMGRALAEHKGCAFSVRQTIDSVFVCADRERVLQVFSNLIGNSLKVVAEDRGEIALSAELGDKVVDFTVTDNGPGIPPEQVERLFDRFWRGKQSAGQGAGLGLFIARGIVEAHRGTISVGVTSGAGAAIRFQLPVVSER